MELEISFTDNEISLYGSIVVMKRLVDNSKVIDKNFSFSDRPQI